MGRDARAGGSTAIGRGDRLHDRFVVGEELARNHFGTRYAANDEGSSEPVHVTVLDGATGLAVLPGAPQRTADLMREVRTRRIVPLLDGSGTDEGVQWIATAALAGVTLDSVLAAGPLTLEAAARIVADAAEGVAALHVHGLVHGAVRPQAVLVLEDGSATLLEGGVADLLRTMRPAHLTTQSGPVRQPEVRRSADVFALGVLLATALGQVDEEAAGGARPRLPQPVTELVSRATAAATAERPAASSIAAMLRRAAADPSRATHLLAPPVAATQAVGLRERVLGPLLPRTAWRGAGVAAAGVLGAAVVGLAMLQAGSVAAPGSAALANEAAAAPRVTAPTAAPSAPSGAADQEAAEASAREPAAAAPSVVVTLLGATTAATASVPSALTSVPSGPGRPSTPSGAPTPPALQPATPGGQPVPPSAPVSTAPTTGGPTDPTTGGPVTAPVSPTDPAGTGAPTPPAPTGPTPAPTSSTPAVPSSTPATPSPVVPSPVVPSLAVPSLAVPPLAVPPVPARPGPGAPATGAVAGASSAVPLTAPATTPAAVRPPSAPATPSASSGTSNAAGEQRASDAASTLP